MIEKKQELLKRLSKRYLSEVEQRYLTLSQKWEMIKYSVTQERRAERDRRAVYRYRQRSKDVVNYDITQVSDRLDSYNLSDTVKIMICKWLYGYSHDEIAKELGVHRVTVSRAISEAGKIINNSNDIVRDIQDMVI